MLDPYAKSLDAIRDLLVERAGRYKRLVILVSLGGLAVALAAIILGSFQPLLALTLMPSLGMAFVACDLRAVQRWRAGVLMLWSEGTVHLDLLSRTARQVPNLPRRTVEGMLGSLPTFNGREVPLASRPQLVEAQGAVARIAIKGLAIRSCMWALAAASPLAAWHGRRPIWLSLWLVLPLASMIWRRRSSSQLASISGTLRHTWIGDGVDPEAGASWLHGLDVQGLPTYQVSALRTTSGPHA